MSGGLRRAFQPVTDALAAPFIWLRVPPTAVTLLTLLPGFATAWAASEERWLLGFGLGLMAGFMDLIDGAVARRTGRVTAFGGFVDSVVDRVIDLAVLFGIGLGLGDDLGWLLVGLAALGSYGTSYVRARAYEAGAVPKAGWNQFFERGERLIVLGLGFLAQGILVMRSIEPAFTAVHAALGLVGVLATLTMLRRVFLVRRALQAKA